MTTLRIDDVIEVDDRDYRYGIGPLILHVTRIGQRQRTADGEWLDLEGLEPRRDGTRISQQPRPCPCAWVGCDFGRVVLMPGRDRYGCDGSPVGAGGGHAGSPRANYGRQRKAPRCYVTLGSVVAGASGRACREVPLVRLPTRGRAVRLSLVWREDV